MDRLTRSTLGLGLAILLLALVLIAGDLVEEEEEEEEEVIPIIVVVASGLLFFAIVRAYVTRKGEVYKDERTQKIQNSALAISWWVAYVVMAATYLLSMSEIVQITLENFIPLMFLVMLATYWVAKVYLSRRGLR